MKTLRLSLGAVLILVCLSGCGVQKQQSETEQSESSKTDVTKPRGIPLSEVEFEITGENWEQALASTETGYVYTRRLDFKIKNNSQQDITSLKVKAVFILEREEEKELWDESQKTVIWSSETPLASGFVKRDWITSAKGPTNYYYATSIEANIEYQIYLDINNSGWQKVK